MNPEQPETRDPMPSNDHLSRLKTARLVGVLYFIFAAIGIWGYMYVHPATIAAGDAAATAKKMLDNEMLFRLSKAAGVISLVLFILIVLLLQKLLRHIDRFQAKLMVVLVVVSLPVGLMVDAMEITALSIFKGSGLKAFSPEQAQEIAMTLIKTGSNAGQILTLLWGLWLFPLGYLVYKSGFIPRIFGVLLVINGIGYVIHSFTFILFPDQMKTVLTYIFPTYFAGEIPFIFWLLLKGVKTPRT